MNELPEDSEQVLEDDQHTDRESPLWQIIKANTPGLQDAAKTSLVRRGYPSDSPAVAGPQPTSSELPNTVGSPDPTGMRTRRIGYSGGPQPTVAETPSRILPNPGRPETTSSPLPNRIPVAPRSGFMGDDRETGMNGPAGRGGIGRRIIQVASGRPPAAPALPASPLTPPATLARSDAADPTLTTTVAPPTTPPAALIRKETPGSIPAPPTGANNLRRMDLLRQMGSLEKPTDPNAIDPQTGKRMYRMGLGQRIAGTAGNFLRGFGGYRGEPTYVGPGALNNRYYQTEGQRERQLGGVKEELGEQEKLDTSEQKIYEDAMRQAYEGQLGEARTASAEAAEGRAKAAGETADVKAQLAESQRELNEARAQKAGEPKEPTNEFSGWYQAFQRDNKRPPSAKEIAQHDMDMRRAGRDTSASDTARAIQVAEYKGRQLDAMEKEKQAEREKRYAELDKNVQLKYNAEKLAAEKQKIDSALDTKYAPRAQQISDEADKLLGLTKAGEKLKSNTSSTSTPKKLNQKDFPVGSTVNVDGKPRKVVGWNPKTGKPIVAPLGS